MGFFDFFRNLLNPKFEIYLDNGRPSREDVLSLIQELHQRLKELEKRFDSKKYAELRRLGKTISDIFIRHGDTEAYEHFKNWSGYDSFMQGEKKDKLHYFHQYFDSADVFVDHIRKDRYYP